jgi:hypothetical protein
MFGSEENCLSSLFVFLGITGWGVIQLLPYSSWSLNKKGVCSRCLGSRMKGLRRDRLSKDRLDRDRLGSRLDRDRLDRDR